MTSTMLQMISVGTLLLLSHRTSAARCINKTQLKSRVDDYYKYWNETSVSTFRAQDARPWAPAARGTHGDEHERSLSPWKYLFDHDADRIPDRISFAQCLSYGCIFSEQESSNYNSVPVFSDLLVLKKTPCPTDPRRFVLQKKFIKVQVACTCVVPKYNK